METGSCKAAIDRQNPAPALDSEMQLRMTQLTSLSVVLFGSKSIPACGAVPAVCLMTVFSIRRSSALITLIPWR